MRGSGAGCGDPLRRGARCFLPPPCLLGAQHRAQRITAAVPGLGLSKDLEAALHRKLCSETGRDDKQPDGSRSVPAQEYLCCKQAGPIMTRARFTCLICCSWERWICFPAAKRECDESICLLRLQYSLNHFVQLSLKTDKTLVRLSVLEGTHSAWLRGPPRLMWW